MSKIFLLLNPLFAQDRLSKENKPRLIVLGVQDQANMITTIFADPKEMIKTHFPENLEFQLLEKRVTWEEF